MQGLEFKPRPPPKKSVDYVNNKQISSSLKKKNEFHVIETKKKNDEFVIYKEM